MSLMSLRQFITKYGTWIWITVALTFVAGSFIGLGNSALFGSQNSAAATSGDPIVAVVGDREVTQQALDQQMNRALEQQRQFMPMGVPPSEYPSLRLRLLDNYKQQQALAVAAEKANVVIADADIERARDAAFAQQRPRFAAALGLKEDASDRAINDALARTGQRLTIEDLKASVSDEALRDQLRYEKLRDTFKAELTAKATPARVKNNYSEVKVRHILVKSGEGGLPDEQAKAKAQKLLDAVKKDVSVLPRLADENSDDPGNAGPGGKKQGGLYDWAPASRYVPAFTEAALAAKPGTVYPELVKTPFGYHIIKSEGVRPGKDLPKDFDTNQQKYIDEFVTGQAEQRVQEAIAAVLPSVTVKVQDPELRAAQLQAEAQTSMDAKQRRAKLQAALDEVSKVKAAGDRTGSAVLMRASLLEALDRPKEAATAYEESLKFRNTLETRLALARLHLKQKDKTAALAQLQAADKLVRGELNSQMELASLYRQAGAAALAQAADKKASEMMRRQAELAKAQGAGATAGGNIALPERAPAPPAAPPAADDKSAQDRAAGTDKTSEANGDKAASTTTPAATSTDTTSPPNAAPAKKP